MHKIVFSVSKKNAYIQVFDLSAKARQAGKNVSKTRLAKFLKPRSLLFVNDCFKNEYNAVFGVFLQRLFSILIVFLLAVKPINVEAHPLHLSITNIDIVGDSVKVAIKVFIDDFSAVVQAFNKVDSSINLSDNSSKVNEYIMTYINQRFKLNNNANNINLNYTDKEVDDLSVWIYLEGKINLDVNSLNIENSLFCNWFGDQKNIVIISYKGNEKGLVFSSSETKKTVTLVK